jgi:hypothetical protein
MDGIKRILIKIETTSKEETMRIGTKIHEQLVGNKDYINDNIILNCTSEPREIYLCFDGVDKIPEIKL